MSDSDDESRETRPPRPMTLLAGIAWACGFVLLVVLATLVTEAMKPREQLDVVNATACIVLAYSVVLFAMVRVHAPHASLREVLGIRAASPVGVIGAIVSGAALYPAASLVDDWFHKRFPLPEDETLAERMPPLATMGERVVVVIAFALVVPLFEELFYRGMIYAGLRRGRLEGPALVGCTAIYALVQGQLDARLAVSASLLGLLTAWMRARSGSLIAPIATHVAYVAIPSALMLMRKDDVDIAPKIAIAGGVIAALSAFGTGVLFQRDARGERGRLLDA